MNKKLIVLFLLTKLYWISLNAQTNPDIRIPLIKTQWGQDWPYNISTPECTIPQFLGESVRKNTLIGCTAVAYGQLVRYYQYPSIPQGTLTKENSNCNSDFQSNNIQIDLSSLYFDFANMPNTLNEFNLSNDVSKLLEITGKVLNQTYGINASSGYTTRIYGNTNIPTGIINMFEFYGYSLDAQLIERKDVSSEANYEKLIIDELTICQPVLMRGQTPSNFFGNSEGHMFIIDGYNSDLSSPDFGKFHINWGWSGHKDGWFDLSKIGYSENNSIIIGLKPLSLENACAIVKFKSLGEITSSKKSKVNSCPRLLIPSNDEINVTDITEIIWSVDENAKNYLVTINAPNSMGIIYDEVDSYAATSSFSLKEPLPAGELIEVTIKSVDFNGNISNCSVQYFTTSQAPCNLNYKYVNTICATDESYSIELDFSGIPGDQYDIFAEWDGEIYASSGGEGVSQGYHVIGPINSDQEVALIIENEQNPNKCKIIEVVYPPKCLVCPEFNISTFERCVGEDQYDIEITISSASSETFTIVQSNVGVVYSDVSAGTYTIEDVSKDFSPYIRIIPNEESSCAKNVVANSPNCESSLECSLISASIQSPTNGRVYDLGATILFNWSVTETDEDCLKLFQLQSDNSIDNILNGSAHTDILTLETSTIRIAASPYTIYWRVRAQNVDNNWGEWTDIQSFTINNTSGNENCAKPTSLTHANVHPSSVQLLWDDVNPGGSYKVEWGSIDRDYTYEKITNDRFSYLTNLIPDTQYKWRVSSLCGNNQSSYSFDSFKTANTNQTNIQGDLFLTRSQVVPYSDLCLGSEIEVEVQSEYCGTYSNNSWPVRVSYFLSKDNNWSSDDLLLSTDRSQFNIGGQLNTTRECDYSLEFEIIELPMEFIQKNMFILYYTDFENLYIEEDESNNLLAEPITIRCKGCLNSSAHNYDPTATIDERLTCETCNDGIKNGDELEIDCGGNLCNPCYGSCEPSTDLTVGSLTSNSARLTWLYAVPPNSYTMYYKAQHESVYNSFYTSATSINLTNLKPSTQYCWFVRSNCDTGESNSLESCFSTGEGIFGCTEVDSHNYSQNATDDDGSCESCHDQIRNGDETDVDCGGIACIPCECEEVDYEVDFNIYDDYVLHVRNEATATKRIYNSEVSIKAGRAILLNPGLEVYEGSSFLADIEDCGPEILGCKDINSHNYNPVATSDNGSCQTCDDGIKNGDEVEMDCGGSLCESCPEMILGCMDVNAHNFNATATIDDGSCLTCNDGIKNGDEEDEDCGGSLCDPCPEIVMGCMEMNSHNYNAMAEIDDGSCLTCNDEVKNGDEEDIDCGGSLCEACPEYIYDIDGNRYTTVVIGGQEWMAENLAVTHLNDGTSISFNNENNNSSYTWYGENIANKINYGALYNLNAAKEENLCPSGWRVPSQADWKNLIDYLMFNGFGFGGNQFYLGKPLAAHELWANRANFAAPGNNPSQNNSSGFAAIPAGYKPRVVFVGDPSYRDLSHAARFWSTTGDDNRGYGVSVFSNVATINDGLDFKGDEFLSVRCIKQ